jgi:Na+-translocating ferredoxin:NAD+ oxidoreductase subunit G
VSNELLSKSLRNARLLGVVALLGAGLLASINYWARPQVELNRTEALRAQLAELVPAQMFDQPLDTGEALIAAPALGPGMQRLYRARLNDQVTAVLVTVVATDGYNGNIRLLMAVNGDGVILGARVLEHSETPGLGDAIEKRKSDWVLGFDGRSLQNPQAVDWAVRKDGGQFDQITAATITPRAVVGAVKRGLEYIQTNRADLFETQHDE